MPSGDLVEGINQEVGILKVYKNTEIDKHRDQGHKTAKLGAQYRCEQAPYVVEQDQAYDQG